VSALDLARWQFGITTVYHFIFVPLTIGLAPMVAIMQTAWVRTGNEQWLRMTKFFGHLFLINFAMGVVTGIVQEFQFGMGWSTYSAFVGDIFGAPLAMEALIAFFLESVFLGVWIFGWDRVGKKTHLASIWLVAIAVDLSAYFIIVANSFMQHPVGAILNAEKGRAELESSAVVLTNETAMWALPHTVTAAFVTAATLVGALSIWWMVKNHKAGKEEEAAAYRPALSLSLVVLVVAGIGVLLTGHGQAQALVHEQPMKMAAAEALCDTEDGAGFSIVAFGIGDIAKECNSEDITSITVPGVTAFLATNSFNGTVEGVNELKTEYVNRYSERTELAAEDYVPPVLVTFWTFRIMIAMGAGAALIALFAWLYTRKGKMPTSSKVSMVALLMIPTPYLANFAGWILAEMGRQPWIVAPVYEDFDPDNPVYLATQDAVSPVLVNSTFTIGTSLVLFTVLYGTLAVIWFTLMRKYASQGAPQVAGDEESSGDDAPMSFAY
jgi:cytochrome bd ubiquinol oxidase subunit I